MSFASLHGGLLVRKGEARPSPLEPAVAAVPAPPEPVLQAERRDVLAFPKADAAPAPRPATTRRVGLSLSEPQARRLRVAGMLLGRPQKRILADALDVYLDALAHGAFKGCGCLSPTGEADAGVGCCSGPAVQGDGDGRAAGGGAHARAVA